jgi:hypothetical protein
MLSIEALRSLVDAVSVPARPSGLRVAEIKVEETTDHYGNDALDVFVVVPEGTPEGDLEWSRVEYIDRWIRERLSVATESRFPFIRFGTDAAYQQRYNFAPDSDE